MQSLSFVSKKRKGEKKTITAFSSLSLAHAIEYFTVHDDTEMNLSNSQIKQAV